LKKDQTNRYDKPDLDLVFISPNPLLDNILVLVINLIRSNFDIEKEIRKPYTYDLYFRDKLAPFDKIQIVLTKYESHKQLLDLIDIDCTACMLTTDLKLLMTEECLESWQTKLINPRFERNGSIKCKDRLIKYMYKGFIILTPNLDIKKIMQFSLGSWTAIPHIEGNTIIFKDIFKIKNVSETKYNFVAWGHLSFEENSDRACEEMIENNFLEDLKFVNRSLIFNFPSCTEQEFYGNAFLKKNNHDDCANDLYLHSGQNGIWLNIKKDGQYQFVFIIPDEIGNYKCVIDSISYEFIFNSSGKRREVNTQLLVNGEIVESVFVYFDNELKLFCFYDYNLRKLFIFESCVYDLTLYYLFYDEVLVEKSLPIWAFYERKWIEGYTHGYLNDDDILYLIKKVSTASITINIKNYAFAVSEYFWLKNIYEPMRIILDSYFFSITNDQLIPVSISYFRQYLIQIRNKFLNNVQYILYPNREKFFDFQFELVV